MAKYIINGGKVNGKVKIDSAKNALLPMIAASVLTEEEVVIKSCSKISDVLSMVKILKSLGVSAVFYDDDLVVNASGLNYCFLSNELTKSLRTSVLMLGALIAKCHKVEICYPGGCEIGCRPIDIHLKSLEKLGVKICDDGNILSCVCDNLIGAEIKLFYPSVGATENLLLCAVLAKGVTKIYNYAKEPEVIDLIKMLNSMGSKIAVTDSVIIIEGVEKLHGTEHVPIPDRIEAGTFLLLAEMTGGEIEISNAKVQNILPLFSKFCDNTCNINIKNDIIYLKSGKCRNPFDLVTGPYPFFPTDLQAQMSVLACLSNGQSSITETVFENRFGYLKELVKMGARVKVENNTAYIKGVDKLQGATVRAKDLRGGAALVLAGSSAEGQTVVLDIEHIERGYYAFENKLTALGIRIKKEE